MQDDAVAGDVADVRDAEAGDVWLVCGDDKDFVFFILQSSFLFFLSRATWHGWMEECGWGKATDRKGILFPFYFQFISPDYDAIRNVFRLYVGGKLYDFTTSPEKKMDPSSASHGKS
jgi:hypothetical protein